MARTNNYTIRTKPVEENDLVLARTDSFYFLELVEYAKDLFDSTKIRSKPSIIFYTENSTNKVILDYSLANDEDKLFLKAFFAKMGVDETFNIINGQYLDDTVSIDADVSSVLKFKKYSEDLVFAEVTSTTNKDTNVDQYILNYFINTPQLTKAASLQASPDTKIKALVSRNPKYTAKPLVYLGYQPGDIIEIICPTSLNNTKKFTVSDAGFINDKEVIYLENANDMIEESLIGKMVIINLYLYSKISSTDIGSLNQNNDLGCAIDSANEIRLPYQTQKQASLRGEQYAWVAGSCTNTTINLNGSVTTSLTSVDSAYAIKAQEIYDANLALLKNSINVTENDALTAFFKKKTITNSSNLINGTIDTEIFSASPPTNYTDPFEQFFEENIIKYSVPAILDSKVKLQATQAFIPASALQDLGITGNNFVQIQTDTNIYRLLNISYEAVITDTDIRIRTFDGNLLSENIKLSKNIITTIYETNTTGIETERLIFSSTENELTQVLDFGQYGYGYVQLGRYHMLTPLKDELSPLYLFTTTGKRCGSYINGAYYPAVISNYQLY